MRNYKFVYNYFCNISILLWIFFFCPTNSTGQALLVNGSFEDDPADATTPHGWFECNAYTTPDILPGFWGVYLKAAEGDTYVGLITRSNSTNEAIGQRLSQKLSNGQCYQFKVSTAFSRTYAGYNDPLKLRIWLGDTRCGKSQLIAETGFIRHTDWKPHVVKFTPDSDAEYIFFEAYYSDPPFSYKGNLLIDGISPIVPCGKA